MAFLVWCVIGGMGLALYEAAPEAGGPKTRKAFNKCMRQVVLLSDEITRTKFRAQQQGHQVWESWEAEFYLPTLEGIRIGCGQFATAGVDAALMEIEDKKAKAKETAITFRGQPTTTLGDATLEITRQPPTSK